MSRRQRRAITVQSTVNGPAIDKGCLGERSEPSGLSSSWRRRSARIWEVSGPFGIDQADVDQVAEVGAVLVAKGDKFDAHQLPGRGAENGPASSDSLTSGLARGSYGRTVSLAKTMWTAIRN